MDTRNFSIIDVETTGGSPFWNRVIEIGIIRVEKGEVAQTYQTLLNPERPLPEFITGLTGITDAQLINAPTFDEVKDEVLDLLTNSIFVAHNASFDYGFIKQEFARHGYGFTADQLCTVRLSRVLYPKEKHHNLDAVMERFGFSCENRHRALDDAKVLWEFLQVLPSKFDHAEIKKTIDRTIQKIPPAKQRKLDAKPQSNVSYIYNEQEW